MVYVEDQFCQIFGFFWVYFGGWFIEQEQFWCGGQCVGDFYFVLVVIVQVCGLYMGEVGDVDIFQDGYCFGFCCLFGWKVVINMQGCFQQ